MVWRLPLGVLILELLGKEFGADQYQVLHMTRPMLPVWSYKLKKKFKNCSSTVFCLSPHPNPTPQPSSPPSHSHPPIIVYVSFIIIPTNPSPFGAINWSTVCGFLSWTWVHVGESKLHSKAAFHYLQWQVSTNPKAPRDPPLSDSCLLGSISERASGLCEFCEVSS